MLYHALLVDLRDRLDLLVTVKPWVKIDGSLNRRVLDRLLGSVLSHIFLKPGCSVYQVAERFHPALQPFQTRELVEVLLRVALNPHAHLRN